MTNKFLLPLSLSAALAGCAMEEGRDSGATTTDGGSAGGYYENLPGNGDGGSAGDGGTTDGGTGDDTGCDTGTDGDGGTGDGGSSDGGTDGDGGGTDGGSTSDGGSSDGGTGDGGTSDGGTTDGGSSEPTTETVTVWLAPDSVYDVSHDLYGVSTPEVCHFEVVVNGDFPSDYGACIAYGYNVYTGLEVTYVPGDDLTVQFKWDDGVRDRFLAEFGGVVNLLEDRIVLEFPDGTWQGYVITGEAPTDHGQAGWVPNGDGSGGQIAVKTYEDTLDHHDREE